MHSSVIHSPRRIAKDGMACLRFVRALANAARFRRSLGPSGAFDATSRRPMCALCAPFHVILRVFACFCVFPNGVQNPNLSTASNL